MMNVLIKFKDTGTEQLYEANHVEFVPTDAKDHEGNPVQCPGLIVYSHGGGSTHFTEHTPFNAFVMNSSGQTVASYRM